MNAAFRFLLFLFAVVVTVALFRARVEVPRKQGVTPPGRTRVVTVLVEVTRTPDPADVITVFVTPTARPTSPAPTATPVVDAERLMEQFRDARFGSLAEMPPDLFHYYSTTLHEIAAFFGVRTEDLLAALQEQNGGMIRLANDRKGGVAGIPPQAWNGWAYPLHDMYLSDVRLIAQHDGLGFDWRQRTTWLEWVAGRSDSANLNGAQASPDDLTDSMAALANFLVRAGVTAQAARDQPEGADARLARSLDTLREGAWFTLPPLAGESAPSHLSAPLRAEFNHLLDQTWGVQFSEIELAQTVDRSVEARAVVEGTLTPPEGAQQLMERLIDLYLEENQRREEEGRPLAWPFVKDDLTLRTQLYAVKVVGHPLAAWEVSEILRSASNDRATSESRIAGRADARVYSGARNRMDESLRRSERGLPLNTWEVARLVQPVLQHRSLGRVSSVVLQEVMDGIEYQIRALPEFQAAHGKLYFASNPLDPWPQNIGQRFGAPASYQPGGRHTGIDVRGARDGGGQPVLYAVDDAVVAHAGPLYCLGPSVCRGPHAIVLDHGGNVYSIYSHNSEAWVETGDVVSAGQAIGRQGSEGYSRGSHLHFEIHVGAPYTGVWQEPFRGGEFINPLPWLPRDLRLD